MKRCDVCGVALDGHARKPQQLVVMRNGAVVHVETYCVQHADRIVDGYRDVRDAVGNELVALRGGEA